MLTLGVVVFIHIFFIFEWTFDFEGTLMDEIRRYDFTCTIKTQTSAQLLYTIYAAKTSFCQSSERIY